MKTSSIPLQAAAPISAQTAAAPTSAHFRRAYRTATVRERAPAPTAPLALREPAPSSAPNRDNSWMQKASPQEFAFAPTLSSRLRTP